MLEGGARQSAFIAGEYIPDEIKGKKFDEYPIDVTDWHPTLLYASGLNIKAKINEGNENNNDKSNTNSSINSNNSINSKNGNRIPKMIVGIKNCTKLTSRYNR